MNRGCSKRRRYVRGKRKYGYIKEWDDGYLVVMAKYSHREESEEDYIDLVPILENLYIQPEEFLKSIKEVRIENA